MEIRNATEADIPGVRELLRQYVAWIALDLAFQEIDAELSGLPGKYAPPRGALLVAGEPMMGDAQSLYEAYGFRDIAPYYDTAIEGTRFMAKTLE